MNFLAIVMALGLEQWRTTHWRGDVQRAFIRYAHRLEQRFNGGAAKQGALAAMLALFPPVALAGALYWAFDRVNPLLGVVWNVAIVYLLVGFRHFSHAFTAIGSALKAGDANSARRRLAAWRGSDASFAAAEEIPKLAIEQGFIDSYRHVFGTLFWFLVLPGPAGAVLYRLTVLLASEWRADATTPMGLELSEFGRPVQQLLDCLLVKLLRGTALLLQPYLQLCDLGDASDVAAGDLGELGIDLRRRSLCNPACCLSKVSIDVETTVVDPGAQHPQCVLISGGNALRCHDEGQI